MGCGCREQREKLGCYDHTKKLAERFAKAENVLVFLYKTGTTWNFMEAGKETDSVTPVEYISPLQ